MGNAVTTRRYLRHRDAGYACPLIFCREIYGITDNTVSMNVPIALQLAKVSPALRSMRLESCLLSALSNLPECIVIRDIDVLFNPSYEVDVLSLICSAYRKCHFDLVWPGRFENGLLLYSEESYPDYRTFNISRYDITCIH